MALIYAKPNAGIILPLPDGRSWPEAGEWVDTGDRYVRRRLADGDIVETDAPAQDSAAETAGEIASADAAPALAEADSKPADAAEVVQVTPKTSGKRSA